MPRYTLRKVIQDPSSIQPGMITKIKDMPNADSEVLQTTFAFFQDTPKGRIVDMINFMGNYVKDTIGRGKMETVMLPYFGKYAPNIKLLQAKTHRIKGLKNGKYMLELALRGKNINFVPQVNPISHEDQPPSQDAGLQPADEQEISQESLTDQDQELDNIEDSLGDDSWNVE